MSEDDERSRRRQRRSSIEGRRGTSVDSAQDKQTEEERHFVPPATLVRLHSATPSLQLQAPSRDAQPRGYAWRDEGSKSKGFVPPSHRNPTALQAFYDTRFGSSSNWRTIRRPFTGAVHLWKNKHNPLSRRHGRESSEGHIDHDGEGDGEEEQTASMAEHIDQSQQRNEGRSLSHLLSLLPISPGLFGFNSAPLQAEPSSASKSIEDPRAYEPELIPTTHRDALASYYYKKLEGNVVVLGGYRGSVLRDAATRQMLWVPLKVGVGLRRPTLEIGLSEGDEEHSEDLVFADEMLSEIGSMVDSGRRLMQRCSTKRTAVHSFGYDWRLGLGRSSKRLEEFLFRLWEDSAEDVSLRKGARVVAHSMGGLVALHALGQSKTPQIFESLVFASTPFLGTPNILGPLRIGDAALFNDEICSPRATFTFRSTFYLLPTEALQEGDSRDTKAGRCFEEEDGTPHDIDFLSIDTWNDLGFSPCVPSGTRAPATQDRTMNTAKVFDALRVDEDARKGQQVDEKAESKPALPVADLQMSTSDDTSMPQMADGVREAVKAGQHLARGKDDTNETVQPENRQKATPKTGTSEKDMQPDLEARWKYLERTLCEVKQFVYELRTSFDQERFARGDYPPMAILTSGRTPTVRGALTWPHSPESDDQQSAAGASEPDVKEGPSDYWKETARKGDYSRMLYAPGDGVILRRSSTNMPGQWGRCLVRGASTAHDVRIAATVKSLAKHKKHDELDTLDLSLTSDEGVVETSHRHVTLLSDVNGIGRCLEACRRARSQRRGVVRGTS